MGFEAKQPPNEQFTAEQVKPDHFDADYYEANGQIGDRPALGYYTRLVKRYVGAGPYLDFGCGTGHLVKHLAGIGTAAGFEISEYSAQTARSTAPSSTIYTSLEQIPSGHFNGLTSVHVLEHLDDEIARSAVATWLRVLRPGGRALVVMPDPAGRACMLAKDAWNGYSDKTHINLKPHVEWRNFLTSQGLAVVHEGSDGMWNVPYSNRPKLVDAAIYAVPAFAQFLSGRLALKPGSGESSIFVLETPR